ncbi:TraG family conjugative transposon ATPase, partial [Phocaeicola vulgatus]|uniref:TraG family conjugative transposon ATPase n=2 Tax=Bacteroidales TaxID=171549 RepID=UPI0034A29B71
PKRWLDFHAKVSKTDDILTEKHIRHRKLGKEEVSEYCHRFMAFQFRHGPFSMTNFKASDEYLRTGDRIIRSYPLVDIDEINLPSMVKPYTQMNINGYGIATDLLSFLTGVPYSDCVVFNQVIQIPGQRKLLRKLQAKAKRHGSMPDPSNRIAKADIEEVLDRLAVDSTMLVYCNFNILVSCPPDKVTPVTSFLETKLYECGIMPSRTAYNQLELFMDCFPGNGYAFNPDYDLFLTLSDAALCFFFKEHLKESEDTPLTTYYTDRQGLPVCIDITGKEGKRKMTDNANFFCIGPSGSGKSFHMNSVVRQLLEQNTDVVMVDTGDSYEGICGYYKGTYIAYSKEKPISMNPFKVTKEEYELNFGEKKNFLKSLIFLIFKGNAFPTKIEDMLINQTIVEYYEAYFNPFEGFSDSEREALRQKLLVAAKMEDDYEQYTHSMEDIDRQINTEEVQEKAESRTLLLPSEVRRLKLIRQCRSLTALINDEAATESEKERALAIIEKYKRELYNNSMLIKIDRQIDHMEEQKRRLKVQELSFNSYYEFALERIPQITQLEKISFNIHDFAAILKQFYRGGELEMTLNSDLDINLFDERFIVFEIDKIKDDPVLFPIVVLIIMDVFLQKMRIKKGRKALIIEEAWKAIASPTMAEYIKYLYKTVRKFHGIAGVVTQELNDVIDSPIVKEAIINNSDVKILLDQTKFKDRYEDIAAILGLTDIQRQQIFTINALNNHEGRSYFKEVWICRGQHSDVYGVEEAPECYWAYTTERTEKEALKIYLARYGTLQEAITRIEEDRKADGGLLYLEFARKVNQHQKVMSLW